MQNNIGEEEKKKNENLQNILNFNVVYSSPFPN